MGDWMRHVGHYVGLVPNVVSLPILGALIGAFVYAVVKRGSRPGKHQRTNAMATGAHPGAPESVRSAVSISPEPRTLT
jgi:hypothetical protein